MKLIEKLIIAWFTWLVNFASPYRSILHRSEGFSGKISIPNVWRLSNSMRLSWEKVEQCNRKWSVVSIEFARHIQKGSRISKNPCLNLCSRKWLKPTRSRVSKITPLWLLTRKTEEGLGLRNSKIARLKLEIDGRSLIQLSRIFHCEIQYGKKEFR